MSVPSTSFTDQYANSVLDLTGYKVTFEDNFDSLKLAGNGTPGQWYSGVHSDFGEAGFIRSGSVSPFSTADGNLNIQMKQVDGEWKSGLLQTTNSTGEGFSQAFGYFEMRAKLPGGAGSWPAFWLISDGHTSPTLPRVEVDTIEGYGLDTNGYHTAVHYSPGVDTPEITEKMHGGDYTRLPNTLFDDQYHTYGTLITDEWVITYYDGKELARTAANEYTRSPFYMIVDLAMSGDVTKADPNAVYNMQVDYIRAYSNPELTAQWSQEPLPSGSTLGGNGNDILAGTTGADVLTGGKGDDIYYVNHANDIVVERSNEGLDTVNSSVSYTLSANVENLKLIGTADIDATGNGLANILTGNSGANILNGGAGADTMIGGAGDDTYYIDNPKDIIIENGREGFDTVYSSINYVSTGQSIERVYLTGSLHINATGWNGTDLLYGNVGDNILDGRAGADVMVGGKGNDTYYVEDINDKVIELPGEGNDKIIASFDYTLQEGSNIETLQLNGTALKATGSSGNDTLIGNDLDNILDGKGGSDIMRGGKGNDTYYVDNINDKVSELVGEGNDQIFSSVSYSLAGRNVEKLTLTGTANLNGSGSAGNDIILGNSGNNILTGGAGEDTLTGGAGHDTLTGDGLNQAFHDVFVMRGAPGATNSDIITDFQHGIDTIALVADSYNFGRGAIGSRVLEFGTQSNLTGVHLIYDQHSGNLFYDADGSGKLFDPQLIANLSNHAELSASDFVII